MHQYVYQLLPILLAATSVCAMTPCQAQTAKKVNNDLERTSAKPSLENVNNISSQSSDSAISEQNKVDIVADSEINPQSTSKPASANQAQVRVPVPCRIFSATSMQQ